MLRLVKGRAGIVPYAGAYLRIKSHGHLLKNNEMIYRFIREHTGKFRVEKMCRVLKVSWTAYYSWLVRPVSQHGQQDKIIKEQIVKIYKKSRKTHGSPRIRRNLSKQGIHCSKKTGRTADERS